MYKTLSTMHVDDTRAYFYADANRDILVILLAEDQEANDDYMCGTLKKAMYGTRGAAQTWQPKCAGIVR